MTDIIAENIYLILFLPLWVFLIVMLGRFCSVYVNRTITNIITLLSSALGAGFSLYLYKIFSPDMVYENTYPFIKINDFIINCGIYIDKTALIFTSVLFLVSFLIQLFSVSYMKDDKKQYKFFALLNLFNFALTGLFLSPNLYQTYVFWEIAGIISYLLIGFEYSKYEKSLASKKVFIINRIGDTAFIGGIIICSYLLYEYAPTKSLACLPFCDINEFSMLIGAYASHPLFVAICVLFLIAAMVKSAQFPFYTWLQDAMEAKLPVSALLHSSTLVALGLYLILRMQPLFSLEPIILKILSYAGILTAFICSLSACAQIHPKKTLAYSTSAQFGLMFFAVGILNIKVGIALFCAHAFIKSMLFITLPNENEKWNYTKFILFLIGGLSLSGVLLSGMMLAKELFTYTLDQNGKIILSVLSFITSFYIIRIALVTADRYELEKKRPKLSEVIPAVTFLMLNIILYIYLRKIGPYKIAESFWAAFTAWIVVYILYIKNAFLKVPFLYELCLNGFYLDKLYTTYIVKIYNKTTKMLNQFDKNILGNYLLVTEASKLSVKIVHWVEENVMNKSVNLVSNFSWRLSSISKQLQTKNVQWYNFYGFIIIISVMSALVAAYAVILTYLKGV